MISLFPKGTIPTIWKQIKKRMTKEVQFKLIVYGLFVYLIILILKTQ